MKFHLPIIIAGVLIHFSTITSTIAQNPSPGVLSFSANTYALRESDGLARITVRRTDGSAGVVSVEYYTADGTAVLGLDYLPVHGTLTLAAGQTERTFAIPLLADALMEGDETVFLALTNATGGATLPNGASSLTATLTILDSDAPSISVPVRKGNTLEFTVEVKPSFLYTVEYCDAMPATSWFPLTNFPVVTSPLTAVVNQPSTNAARRFYRLRLQPAP